MARVITDPELTEQMNEFTSNPELMAKLEAAMKDPEAMKKLEEETEEFREIMQKIKFMRDAGYTYTRITGDEAALADGELREGRIKMEKEGMQFEEILYTEKEKEKHAQRPSYPCSW